MKDSKEQEDALEKQLRDEEQNLKYGLQHFVGHKKKPLEGTIFAYQIGEDGLWRFGRYMIHKASQGFDLVYFYKATSKSKDDIPKLSRDDLLLYPTYTDALDMAKTGYFVNVEHREIKKEDLLEKHVYYSMGRWVDEYANVIEGQKPEDWGHYMHETPYHYFIMLSYLTRYYSTHPEVSVKSTLICFEKYKQRPMEGTIFAYKNSHNDLWYFGRYMKHDCMENKYSLIYLYEATSTSKDDVPRLDKSNLMQYPSFVDANALAKTGYFVNVEHREIKKEDLLGQHYFLSRDRKDKKQWLDYCGKLIKDSSLPVFHTQSYNGYGAVIFKLYKELELKKALKEDARIDNLSKKLHELARFSYSNFEQDEVADYNATFVKKKNWQQDIEKTLNRIFEGDVDISEELEVLYALEVLMAVKGCPSEDVGELRSFKNWVKKHQGEEVPKELMKLGDKVMKYFEKDSLMIQKGVVFGESKDMYRKFWIDEIFKDMKDRWKLAKKK